MLPFNRRLLLLTVGLVAFALAGFCRGQDGQSTITERDVAVPMRDGTILRANVFRPVQGGPFPVLVMRTPYGKPPKVDEQLVKAGFIVVTQDARGRYASEGQYESFVRHQTHGGEDGLDTLAWV